MNINNNISYKKELISRFQMAGIILLTVLTISSCKKIAAEEATANTYTQVVTMAGNGNANEGGFLDGIGNNSAFKIPACMVTDAAGNVYIADFNNHCIRKMTPERVVTTIAGNGESGYVDATGKAAQFSYPYGITIDAAGNLYVGDSGNDAIRKITSSGVVTTYAGNGSGYVDGPVSIAKFYGVSGLAIDKTGNLYAVDAYNYVIRKITPAGIVSTIAGTPHRFNRFFQTYSGPSSALIFGQSLAGIAIDAAGNVYVPDVMINVIWQITPEGTASTWAGNGTRADAVTSAYQDGPRGAAKFNIPIDIACDTHGNIYVADQANNRVRKIDTDGIVSTIAGNGTEADNDDRVPDAEINRPSSVAVDLAGNVYFSTGANNIRKLETITTTENQKNSWNNPRSWGNPKQ